MATEAITLRRTRLGLVACLLVAVTAFVVRLAMVLRGGGLGGLMSYDDGVYYSAAGSLWWGRLPYRDFVLVHPPGILLSLAPFAGLGRLTHDALGFQVARVAWMLVGSLNAALVVVATRRSGLVAATVAGLFYAVWTPAAMTETTTRLEPLVSLGLLVAVSVLSGGRPASRRGQVLAGCALGFATAVKVWAVAPALVVVVWMLVTTGRRAAVRVAGGAALTATVICLPFWLVTPAGMDRMVVLDQLGRGRTWAGTGVRLVSVLGLRSPHGHYWWPLAGWCVAVTVLGAVAVAGSLGSSRGRLAVALLVVQLGVLLASPSYFSYYAAFLAPALALLVAGGVQWARRLRTRGRVGRPVHAAGGLLLAGILAAVVAVGTVAATTSVGTPFPARDLARTVSTSRCVTADSPDVLILTDLLQHDRLRGCRVMVDLSGLSYDGDAMPLRPDGTPVARALNPAWQRDLTGYLFSGDATFLTRTPSDGFSPEALQRLDALPVLRRGDGFVLLAVRPPEPEAAPAPTHDVPMRFTEHELTTALTGTAKQVLAVQRRDVRKGRADIDAVWDEMDRYQRFKILDALGDQLFPVLVALPEVEVDPGTRPAFTDGQVVAAVEECLGDVGGRLRRKAVVSARTAVVRMALQHLPPRSGSPG